jgi:hypothetical protein
MPFLYARLQEDLANVQGLSPSDLVQRFSIPPVGFQSAREGCWRDVKQDSKSFDTCLTYLYADCRTQMIMG